MDTTTPSEKNTKNSETVSSHMACVNGLREGTGEALGEAPGEALGVNPRI